MNLRSLRSFLLPPLCVLLLASCGSAAYREGRELAADGNLEAAVPKLRQAFDDAPGKPEYRSAYLRTRDQYVTRTLEQAESALRNGQNGEAEKLYRKLLDIDPDNARARAGLDDMARSARHAAWLNEAETAIKKQDFETALTKLRAILAENPAHAKALELKRNLDERAAQQASQPQLSAALRKPITIEFKEAPLRQIFEVLARTSGLNFVFDKDVKGEQRSTVFLRNSSVQAALNLVLLTNQLEQRVLDANSILIYPMTAAKQKDYQSMVVKTFFLSNVDLKAAANTLKTIVKTKDLVVDEKQNLIVMRDTPDAVRLAEKLLNLHDMAEPEIMLDVAIVEVTRSRLMDLGIQWPGQLSLSPLTGSGGTVTLFDLQHLNAARTAATLSPLNVNTSQTDSDVRVLANPRIRARNRETAKVMIGDRIPNITSTATATGFVSENIQYVDIGLKLEVQPTVFADNEVAIKIALEVSNIVDRIQTKSGSLAYQIGTRNASTLLKLRDGENQVLAGLIRNEESTTGNGLPLLSEVPLFGRLFGSRHDNSAKTEIVLSITPRLIRNVRRAGLVETEFETGTESNLKLRVLENPIGTSAPVRTTASPANAPIPTVPANEAINSVTPAPIPASAVSHTDATASAPTTVTWQAPASVKTGATFSLQVVVQPGEPLTSIPLAIAYDPKALEIVGVNEGDVLKQEGGATSFSNRIDKGSGQIFATATRTSKNGAGKPGSILTLTCKALAPTAETKVGISALGLIGLNGKAVDATPPAPLSIAITQ